VTPDRQRVRETVTPKRRKLENRHAFEGMGSVRDGTVSGA
jgi:hypothetical protein